jgi:periplasmic protein TonB
MKNKKSAYAATIAALLLFTLTTIHSKKVTAQEKQDSVKSENRIFTRVAEMPVPPFDVNRYLAENMDYPETALKAGITGRVILQFVVNKDGSISNVEIKRDIGGGCGAEAASVVQGMPNWTPGKLNGSPVRVYYTLPVMFK